MVNPLRPCLLIRTTTICSLSSSLGFLVEDQTSQSLWNVENADFSRVMQKRHADLSQRQKTEPFQEPADGETRD